MKQYQVGLIRVITMDDADMVNLHGQILEENYPQLLVESRCLQDQPEGVHDDKTEALAIPKVVEMGLQMQAEGKQAVIISCAGDPGLEQLRQQLSIPVIGAGESVALFASQYAKVGILGITETAPGAYLRILADKIVDNGLPEGITNTLDLLTEGGHASVAACARKQKNSGAEAIALSCTGMSTIGIAAELENELGIPVLDPVLCEGAAAVFELNRAERRKQMQ